MKTSPSMAQTGPTREARATRFASLYPVLLFALVLALVAGIRIRLLTTPLERDEGEYAYGGQLLLQGLPLYKNLYTMKWPGTHAAYALIMTVFGQSPAGIHAGLLIVNLVSACLVFVLGRQMGGLTMGVAAGAAQAMLSVNPMLLGWAGHATHFILLPALAALCLLRPAASATSPQLFFGVGVLLGASVLMKQSGAVFGAFTVAWMIWNAFVEGRDMKSWLPIRLGLLIAGGLLLPSLTAVFVVVRGGFEPFWIWTVKYAHAYTAERSFREGLPDLLETMRQAAVAEPGLWILAILGVPACLLLRDLKRHRVFLFGLLAFSFAGVCPGWYFRQHYFLILMPAIALLAGAAARAAWDLLHRWLRPAQVSYVFCLGLAVIVTWSCFPCRTVFFRIPPEDIWRRNATPNFFADAMTISRFLESRIPAGGKLAVLGSEPEFFFYSHRRSATGYMYMYPLMEPQPYAVQMQEGMIREIEASDPDYVLLFQDPSSWLRQQDSPTVLFEWLNRYGPDHLRLEAWVEKLANGQTAFHWSPPQAAITTGAPCWLAIYRNAARPEIPVPSNTSPTTH